MSSAQSYVRKWRNLVDAQDSGSCGLTPVGVRFPPFAPLFITYEIYHRCRNFSNDPRAPVPPDLNGLSKVRLDRILGEGSQKLGSPISRQCRALEMNRATKNIGSLARWNLALLLALALSGCTKDSDLPTKRVQGGDARRGRALYLSNCAACHNSDPSKDGPVGPAIKGSSEAVIEARLLWATYPPGYTPKRKTSVMPAQPYLKSTIPDLAVFLR